MADETGPRIDATYPPEVLKLIAERFRDAIEQRVPHNRALGLQFVALEGPKLSVRLPYDDKFVGNPETGVLHGGAITTLMDATCGSAVFIKLMKPIPIATLDLRIDYLKPAKPKSDVIARAECFKVTQHIAFVRCECFNEEDDTDLIAVANGTFMIFRGKTFQENKGERVG